MFQAIDHLERAGASYDSAYSTVIGRGAAYMRAQRHALTLVNGELYRSERDLLDPEGLPKRQWFKSTMYATGLYTGFGGDPLPGVGQEIDDRDARGAASEAAKVARAVDRMAQRAERTTKLLRDLPQ
ncbi:MAG: transferrin receptor-like dimerization domain-containing protein [Gemmatimonadaceae bacterium]